MTINIKHILFLIVILYSGLTLGERPSQNTTTTNHSYSKIDNLAKEFHEYKEAELNKIKNFPGNINNISWVKNKLRHLVNIDQKARGLWLYAESNKLRKAEQDYFKKTMSSIFLIDDEINPELKTLLEAHHWFTISKFGPEADSCAWLLIQHQDHDIELQKMVLKRLMSLYPSGETSPSHYAYLLDRIATAEKRPQKYGTQGYCTGKGAWEPDPLEDINKIDELRKTIGLEPLSNYKQQFKEICPN